MKNLKELKGVKVLSKEEQKKISGGDRRPECLWNAAAQCYENCTCGF
ncbi:MAG: hypothetical protein HXX16_01930 [Bacteroidales bacterium]|nr:hypothetical protein [Bacteroidales bacterium]